ncbi:MAG: thymidine phosphorylase [Gemmatimonadales bacterium]|nr:MAG: thymidine phosphorylase [Gemmatimonadales bacterium]
MNPVEILDAKREGRSLDRASLSAFMTGYLEGTVEEYQMAAFLMAVQFRGLDDGELTDLVEIMIGSGSVLELDHLPSPRVDKHSTGGVGDKVSLVLSPLVAEAGLHVPMMSGRGLGHTGGTLDKLEAIPGFRTDLPLDEFLEVLGAERAAMMGQTAEIAPLDQRLYALRSVTGTVPSIPLIAASIMSKKLAEGLDALVLDVKTGSGAFLSQRDDSLALARTMVGIGERYGVRTTALLTAMDRPLGRTAGNALEVREAVECLRGKGPEDLREVVLALSAELLLSAGEASSFEAARERLAELLDGGAPLARFRRLVQRQGGDPRTVDEVDRLPQAPVVREVRVDAPSHVAEVRPVPLGMAVIALGGGRTRLGQEIDPSVGFSVLVQPGEILEEGDLLGRVHAASEEAAREGEARLRDAVHLGRSRGTPGAPSPLISHRVDASGVWPWDPVGSQRG